MQRFLPNGLDVRTVSPLTLAYLGDGVYELLMRESMVNEGNCRPKDLHRVTAGRVCAKAQAAAVKRIQPQLTEEEEAVLKRGRNAHTNRVLKNTSSEEYHLATGLEALFGYLYLTGKMDRILELFAEILKGEADET
ncbi:MAG: ribonuclease III [Clostridiales bacterium]|nr:ribonuclease III [Clostridiales bacterium]